MLRLVSTLSKQSGTPHKTHATHKTPNTHTHTEAQLYTCTCKSHPPQADCHSHTMISKSKRASTPSKSHCVCMHARPIVKHTRTTISFRKPKHVHFLFSQCKLVDAPFLNALFIFLTWYLCTIRPKHLSTCACNLPPNLHSSAKECDSTHIHRAQSCTWQTGYSPSLTHSSNMLTPAPPLAIHLTNTIQSQRLQLSS